MGTILLLLLFSYLLGDIPFVALYLFTLFKVGMILLLSSIPIMGVYAIIKKQRVPFLSSGVGILFFYYFGIIISKLIQHTSIIPFYSEEELVILILFFIMIICFLEMGSSAVFYGSVFNKMKPHDEVNDHLLTHMNKVLNKYLVIIPLVLTACYFLTLFIMEFNDVITSLNQGELFGINLSSVFGILLILTIIISCLVVLWLISSREKPVKA